MQSSCTRSDMEAESACKKLEIKLPITVGASMNQNGPDSQLVGVFSHENAAIGTFSFFKFFMLQFMEP